MVDDLPSIVRIPFGITYYVLFLYPASSSHGRLPYCFTQKKKNETNKTSVSIKSYLSFFVPFSQIIKISQLHKLPVGKRKFRKCTVTVQSSHMNTTPEVLDHHGRRLHHLGYPWSPGRRKCMASCHHSGVTLLMFRYLIYFRCLWMRSMWRGFGSSWKMPYRKYKRKITQDLASRNCTEMRTQWCCTNTASGCIRDWRRLLLSI